MTLRVAAEQFTSTTAVRADETCGCVTGNDPSDADLNLLIDAASDMLAILSAQRVVGRVTATIRPCRNSERCVTCSCCGLDAIPLGANDPVVTSVKIDGDALAASDYDLHWDRNGWNLVRVNTTGTRTWPSTQEMHLPDTEDDTFSITYTSGIYIDHIIEQAAIELVCQLASDDALKTNALPEGVRTATMGGVNVSTAATFAALQAQLGDVLGPAMNRFKSIYCPTGRHVSEVWAPELETWSFTVPS